MKIPGELLSPVASRPTAAALRFRPVRRSIWQRPPGRAGAAPLPAMATVMPGAADAWTLAAAALLRARARAADAATDDWARVMARHETHLACRRLRALDEQESLLAGSAVLWSYGVMAGLG